MSEQTKPESYSLYYSKYCYFCQKVLIALRNKSHSIELLNVSDRENHMQLVAGGGKGQVPCLRIDKEQQQWLYESDDIIQYIQHHNLLT